MFNKEKVRKGNGKTISILKSFSFILRIPARSQDYLIVDTGQEKFYNNNNEINAPSSIEEFYGQDAQFNGN